MRGKDKKNLEREAIALLIGAVASGYAGLALSETHSWQWRGPDVIEAADRCTVTVGAHAARASTYSTSTISKDGRYVTSRANTYFEPGFDGFRVVSNECMKRAGYSLDTSIAEPALNPDYVRAYREHTGIVLETAGARAAREAAELEAKQAEEGRLQRQRTEEEAIRESPEAKALEAQRQKEVADQCASMSKAERKSSMGRRLCPS